MPTKRPKVYKREWAPHAVGPRGFREEVAKAVSDEYGIGQKKALQIIRVMLDVIAETLMEGGEVRLQDFGKFYTVMSGPRGIIADKVPVPPTAPPKYDFSTCEWVWTPVNKDDWYVKTMTDEVFQAFVKDKEIEYVEE